MQSNHFKTASEMSAHQQDREVQEAMRVRAMGSEEFSEWFVATWGALQDQANAMYAGMPSRPCIPRYFKTMDEKNAYDREREIQFALDYQAMQEAAPAP